MKKWRCKVCGEIIESENYPEQCPRCKVKGEDKFEEVIEGNMTWAAEHVVGIAKDTPDAIKEGLRANFEGECSEPVLKVRQLSHVCHNQKYRHRH